MEAGSWGLGSPPRALHLPGLWPRDLGPPGCTPQGLGPPAGTDPPPGHFFLQSRVASSGRWGGPQAPRVGWAVVGGAAPASPPVCRRHCLPSTCAAWTPWLGVWGPPVPRLHSRGGGRRRAGPCGLRRQVPRKLPALTQHPDLSVSLPRGWGAALALCPAEPLRPQSALSVQRENPRLRDHQRLLGATLAGEKGLKPKPRCPIPRPRRWPRGGGRA